MRTVYVDTYSAQQQAITHAIKDAITCYPETVRIYTKKQDTAQYLIRQMHTECLAVTDAGDFYGMDYEGKQWVVQVYWSERWNKEVAQ